MWPSAAMSEPLCNNASIALISDVVYVGCAVTFVDILRDGGPQGRSKVGGGQEQGCWASLEAGVVVAG